MTHAVYLQTWAFIPAVILCHLPHTLAHFVTELHFKVITGVSHYWLSELRLFSLDTGIWLKIKHHLITLWLSCEDVWKGLCFNFPPGHMGSCTCLCVVWAALMSHKNQELLSTNTTRRLGTVNYRSSNPLWSLFRQHTVYPLFACFDVSS